MKCPNCGFEQKDSLPASSCQKCGIVFGKRESKQGSMVDASSGTSDSETKKFSAIGRGIILILYLPAILLCGYQGAIGIIRTIWAIVKAMWPTALVFGPISVIFLILFYFFSKRVVGIAKKEENPVSKSIWVLAGFYILIGSIFLFNRYAAQNLPRGSFPSLEYPSQSSGESAEKADYGWTIQTLDGATKNFSDFQNKTVFLNFWATWCPPCRAEMPGIQKLYDRCKADSSLKEVEFVLVSNEDSETVNKFMKENGYTFPVYVLKADPPEVFQTQGIPVTFFLSQKGNIALKHVGAANWDDTPATDFVKNLVTSPQ